MSPGVTGGGTKRVTKKFCGSSGKFGKRGDTVGVVTIEIARLGGFF